MFSYFGGNLVNKLHSYILVLTVNYFTTGNCKDDCDPNPCMNNGTCTNGVISFTCNCRDGFTGENCTTNIDDCDPNPCMNNGTCTDGVNSFTCNCVDGFTGENCTTNIDDCDPNPCMNNGTCTNRIHFFTCNCMNDFSGNLCENRKSKILTYICCI